MSSIVHAPSRLPEDVTALAERETTIRDGKESKNAVTKTYHTIKDLLSSKFKKESSDLTQDELNNVTMQTQHQILSFQNEEFGQIPVSIHNPQQTNWNPQVNINFQQSTWQPNDNRVSGMIREIPDHQAENNGQTGNYSNVASTKISMHQHRAASQPQLNIQLNEQIGDNRGSLANIDVTDSDEGGFVVKEWQTTGQQYNQPANVLYGNIASQQNIHQQQLNYLKRNSFVQQQQPQHFSINELNSTYQTQLPSNSFHLHKQGQFNPSIPDGVYQSQKVDVTTSSELVNDKLRVQDQIQSTNQQNQAVLNQNEKNYGQSLPVSKPFSNQQKRTPHYEHPPKPDLKKSVFISTPKNSGNVQSGQESKGKLISGSAASSDYDKSGNHSSNVDSGRGSAAYSSGRKAAMDTSPDHSDTPVSQTRSVKSNTNDSEWIDIVDAELRHILEPGLQNLNLRPESIISGSELSSVSPPLPPLSQTDDNIQCAKTNSNNRLNGSSSIVNKITSDQV